MSKLTKAPGSLMHIWLKSSSYMKRPRRHLLTFEVFQIKSLPQPHQSLRLSLHNVLRLLTTDLISYAKS
ncbi:hypothetical protein Leryth_026416 [Lithospermum erythrorhizon]|nr:hypothetical protein Leryth_026416 [Lithospermum erythrorhizon]